MYYQLGFANWDDTHSLRLGNKSKIDVNPLGFSQMAWHNGRQIC